MRIIEICWDLLIRLLTIALILLLITPVVAPPLLELWWAATGDARSGHATELIYQGTDW